MNILLAEDEPSISGFIKRGLEESGYSVTQAFDGNLALHLAEKHDYDLIILDLILPGLNGLDVCQHLRQHLALVTPILMLTALNETEDVVEGLERGADDYMGKPFEFKELLARIRALTRRRTDLFKKDRHLLIADLEMDLDKKQVVRSGQQIALTPREFYLLQYLMQHHGRVVSRAELLEKVWKVKFDPGTNIIDVYMAYLRKKIDRPFETKLIQTVTGMGYTIG
jgi:two-component system copper resistance phosphate regulon response regulator CusR